VSVCATRHTVPSVGYIVWQRRKKLKAEYEGLAGDQIRDIRLSGVEVSEERRFPLVAYTGDTAPEGLDANPVMYEAKVLITEMSFVAPSHRKEKIHKHGHMHLDDFVERRNRFQNELVIAAHFSTRYHDKQIVHFVRKSLPDFLGGRLHLWL
jgi:ribonuclease Z